MRSARLGMFVSARDIIDDLSAPSDAAMELMQIEEVRCCAVLCCAVLCCAVLCCAVLCCAVLCCAVLCCALLCLCCV